MELATAAPGQRRGLCHRIPVVDDRSRVRKMINMLNRLDEHQLAVESTWEAAGGKEAMRRARTYRPDVVLMDINPPGISGSEAARRIRGEFPAVAAVMVTASEEPGHRQEAAGPGAAGFVIKDRAATGLVSPLRRMLCRPPDRG